MTVASGERSVSVTPPHGWTVHVSNKVNAIASWRSMLFFVVRDTPTIDGLREQERVHEEVFANTGRKIGAMVVVEPGMTIPEGDVRKFASEVSGRVADNLLCTATVILGEGFWLSAAVSVISMIQLLARPGNPNRTFRQLDPACEWIPEYVEDASEGELRRCVEALRQAPHIG